MRITGGQAARRLLRVPKGLAVRPTPDVVKQALFNSLGSRVVGARVLELFAGTGALGLECLSRGARSVVCVEKSPKHAACIRQNAELVNADPEAFTLRVQDVFAAIGQLADSQAEFDLILADPPFGPKNVGSRSSSLSQQLLDTPALARLLAEEGIFVLGHARRDSIELTRPWRSAKILSHGDHALEFLIRARL